MLEKEISEDGHCAPETKRVRHGDPIGSQITEMIFFNCFLYPIYGEVEFFHVAGHFK